MSENLDYSISVPQRNMDGLQFVFTVGDQISEMDKANNPLWRAGGVLRPESLTLKYCHGFIRRFEITELRPVMESTAALMIHPERREDAIKTYQVSEYNKDLRQHQTVTKGIAPNPRTGEMAHDGLVRKQFYPVQEIGRIAQQRDGVVQMPVQNTVEKNMAQEFLFPNWFEIKNGYAEMPKTIAELKAYFTKRLFEVINQDGTLKQVENAAFYAQVARAALLSCEEYTAWGTERIADYNAKFDQAKTKGWAWSYPSVAEMLFVQLNLQRKDQISQMQSDQIGELTKAVTTMAQIQVNQMQNQSAPPPPPKPSEKVPSSKLQVPGEAIKTEPVVDETPKGADSGESEDDETNQNQAEWAVGKHVLTNGREAEILKLNPGGNLQVQFLDGDKEITGVKRANCQLL